MSLPLICGLPDIEIVDAPEPNQLVGHLSNDPDGLYRVRLHHKRGQKLVSITRLS